MAALSLNLAGSPHASVPLRISALERCKNRVVKVARLVDIAQLPGIVDQLEFRLCNALVDDARGFHAGFLSAVLTRV